MLAGNGTGSLFSNEMTMTTSARRVRSNSSRPGTARLSRGLSCRHAQEADLIGTRLQLRAVSRWIRWLGLEVCSNQASTRSHGSSGRRQGSGSPHTHPMSEKRVRLLGVQNSLQRRARETDRGSLFPRLGPRTIVRLQPHLHHHGVAKRGTQPMPIVEFPEPLWTEW